MPDPLTSVEFETLIRLCKRVLWGDRAIRRAIQEHRINIVPSNFYSDIPSVDDIDGSFEFKEADGPYQAVFDAKIMREFLDQIAEYAAEFTPPMEGDVGNPEGFFWKNPAFSFSDAMAYYCVIRHRKPERIIEVGSGFSTLVAAAALRRNGGGRMICIEPFPQPWLVHLGGISLISERVQSIAPSFFNETLSDGDILFIDSTHTVKAGSDCLHLYLRVLPTLVHDLMIHAHDIYLPFPLPVSQFDRHIYWTEQYLLYAYLLNNPKVRVLYGSVYNKHFLGGKLSQMMGGKWDAGGASIWFMLSGRAA